MKNMSVYSCIYIAVVSSVAKNESIIRHFIELDAVGVEVTDACLLKKAKQCLAGIHDTFI